MPCSTRAATSCVNVCDTPQASEPTVKIRIDAANMRRVPKRSDNHALAGMQIASVRTYLVSAVFSAIGGTTSACAILGTAVLTMVESSVCMKNAAATSQIRPRICAFPAGELASDIGEPSIGPAGQKESASLASQERSNTGIGSRWGGKPRQGALFWSSMKQEHFGNATQPRRRPEMIAKETLPWKVRPGMAVLVS